MLPHLVFTFSRDRIAFSTGNERLEHNQSYVRHPRKACRGPSYSWQSEAGMVGWMTHCDLRALKTRHLSITPVMIIVLCVISDFLSLVWNLDIQTNQHLLYFMPTGRFGNDLPCFYQRLCMKPEGEKRSQRQPDFLSINRRMNTSVINQGRALCGDLYSSLSA